MAACEIHPGNTLLWQRPLHCLDMPEPSRRQACRSMESKVADGEGGSPIWHCSPMKGFFSAQRVWRGSVPPVPRLSGSEDGWRLLLPPRMAWSSLPSFYRPRVILEISSAIYPSLGSSGLGWPGTPQSFQASRCQVPLQVQRSRYQARRPEEPGVGGSNTWHGLAAFFGGDHERCNAQRNAGLGIYLWRYAVDARAQWASLTPYPET